ncbi:MAG: hypothetical protein KDD76_02780 [Rickettsiales bacterium]|nr:hypothetical protein [Rickettsiales bacterium]
MLIPAACAERYVPTRTLEQLSLAERGQIENLLQQRQSCLAAQTSRFYNPSTSPQEIAKVVTWECRIFADTIERTMSQQLGFNPNDAWSYADKLRKLGPIEVEQAVMDYRNSGRFFWKPEALFLYYPVQGWGPQAQRQLYLDK